MTNSRGLTLKDMEHVTSDEVRDWDVFYTHTLGHRHLGLDFWLDHRVDVLKRYRQYSDVATPRQYEDDRRMVTFGFAAFYAVVGYDVGVRYVLRMAQLVGMTKAQVLDGVAISFLVVGPRGMDTIELALRDYEWMTPDNPPVFPDGWGDQQDFLASGLDFSVRESTPAEIEALRGWYRRALGEIPPYVDLLAAERPDLLKAYRSRFENCARELPVEFVPTTLLHYNIIRGSQDGIREDVLLCRALGVEKQDVLNIASAASLNGSMEGFSILQRAAGDVLRDWKRSAS